MILCLETATDLCSVALCNSAGTLILRESNDIRSHASILTVFIKEVLNEAGIKAQDLDAVAVSKGPGSYTGLRIGVSVAKGITYAVGVPLIGIDTTLSMFRGFRSGRESKSGYSDDTLFCPMLDARRMEVYYAIYDGEGHVVKSISAEIISEDSFDNIPDAQKMVLFGEGALKCKEVIKRPNIVFDDNFRISASYMFYPALQAFNEHRFEDIAYFEPFYLKDFIISKQRKNVLGK